MKGVCLKNHFSLTSSVEVNEIASPLSRNLSLDYFSYIKIFKEDASRSLLTNHPYWIEHFYKKAFYKNNIVSRAEFAQQNSTYYLWSDVITAAPFQDGKDFFSIKSGITIIKCEDKLTHIYCFGSSKELMDCFYLRNMDLLNRFMVYFLDKASLLINTANKNKIVLPTSDCTEITDHYLKSVLSEKEYSDFVESTRVKRFFLDGVYANNSEGAYLTHKEVSCLYYLILGKTAKEIGRELNISNRTVEVHVEHIKKKLGFARVSVLVNALNKVEINNIIKCYLDNAES